MKQLYPHNAQSYSTLLTLFKYKYKFSLDNSSTRHDAPKELLNINHVESFYEGQCNVKQISQSKRKKESVIYRFKK